MKAVPRLLVVIGLAVAGWIGPGPGTASAQTIYVDPYPRVLPPVTTYVVRRPIVEQPAAIFRERTVVVRRPAYVPAPVYRAPLPPYGYVAELDYVPGW
jgi:hypothetical protein